MRKDVAETNDSGPQEEKPSTKRQRRIGRAGQDEPNQAQVPNLTSIEIAFNQVASGTQGSKAKSRTSKAAAGASHNTKDMNKSDAAYQEACNLLQGLDDTQGIFTLTVSKWSSALEKIMGRLQPEAMDAVMSGGAEQKERGAEKIRSLRMVQEQLKASYKLVEALAAVEGETLDPSFMRSAIQQAKMADVKVSPAVQDILAVRTVTALKANSDWCGIQDRV